MNFKIFFNDKKDMEEWINFPDNLNLKRYIISSFGNI